MVCTKCQRKLAKTTLATPDVKKKSELYYGSPASSSSSKKTSSSASATTAQNGIGKSKLLSKAAKNPYAAYSSSCETCKTKTDQGRKFCQRCAYKANACAMCGKGLSSGTTTAGGKDGAKKKGSNEAPVIVGQKFSAK